MSPAQVATISQLKIEQRSSAFAGPLPPPEHLKQYDEVLPGLADRIVQMAEKQASHRHTMESQVVTAEIKRAYLGMGSGFIVAMLGLTIGGLLVYLEKTVVGSIFFGATLVSLVGVFVYGAHERRKERETKTKIMTGG
jgi:uncharacterized membrane protein